MTLKSWQDAGADFKLFTSTDGDWVSVGARVNYDFAAGGSGVPSGWTPYSYSAVGGAQPPMSDVNLTTSYGRFSVSNATGTSRSAMRYGAYRDFPVNINERLLIQVESRIMDGKDGSNMNRYIEWTFNGGASTNGGQYASQQFMTSDWTDNSIATSYAVQNGYYRVYLMLDNYDYAGKPVVTNWGGQWQNLSIVNVKNTYPSPTWHEVTCDTKSITTRYGRDKFVSRYDVATASITVDNNDGEFTYSIAPKNNLRPGRFVKVTGYSTTGTSYPFYFGVIDSITDSYSIDGQAVAVINCVDPSSLLALKQLATMNDYFSIMKSGSRWQTILINSGWHPQMYSYQPGLFDQQAILASGSSARDELGLVADSEGGWQWCDQNGWMVYRQRDFAPLIWTQATAELLAQPWDGSPLPQVDSIANNASPIPIIPLRSLAPNWSRDRVVNEISVANKGGSAFKKVDGTSQTKYGPRTYQRLDFVNDNANSDQTLTRLNDLMTGYTDAILRIDSVSFVLGDDPLAYKFALTVWLNDLVRVRYQHPTNMWAYAICTHVQSITQTVTPNHWEVILGLDQPISYAEWIAGDAGWDIASWDLGLWDEYPPDEGAYWDSGEIWDNGSAQPNTVAIWNK